MSSVVHAVPTPRLPRVFAVGLASIGLAIGVGSTFAKEYLVSLDYAVAPAGFVHVSLDSKTKLTPFAKEPASASKRWRRGSFQITGSQFPPMDYLWGTDGSLRLDLNHNEDLTDDPGGVYQGDQNSHSSIYAFSTFTNVALQVEADAKAKPVVLDLILWESAGHRDASGRLKSFWSGKIEIDGQSWELGVLDSFSGRLRNRGIDHFLLRPWKDKGQSFSTDAQYTETFKRSAKVFFQERCFAISYSPGESGAGAGGVLKLVEAPVALGELTIDGAHVQRLVLEDPDCAVVLDAPGKSTKLPAGRYKSFRMQLGPGPNGAYRDSDANRARELIVAADKPALLAAGGPLTNSVLVHQRGSAISMDYELVGVGGEAYTFKPESQAGPPRFAIYQGDRKVASGQFEYG